MDSGNSGSLQSSSGGGGGDEEYDSRADLISAFINPSAAHVAPVSTPQQPQPPYPPPQHGKNSTMFDPLAYFDPISRPPFPQKKLQNPLLDLDMVCSRTIRSEDQNRRNEINPFDNRVDNHRGFQSHFTSQNPFITQNLETSFTPVPQTNTSTPDFNLRCNNKNENNTSTARPADQGNNLVVARNSKKRSRASRRAPTTVLTTDTNNFRAMVQEFTGIPSPPFTSTGRFDLFSTQSSYSTMKSFNPLINTFSQPPPYLHRPFPQKIQPPPPPPPFLFSSNVNYPMLNMQNPLENPSIFGSKTQEMSQIPSNDLYGLGFMSSGRTLLGNDDKNLARRGEDGEGSNAGNGKVNYSTSSSSNFQNNNKGNDHNVGARSDQQVMVETWICSSSE